MLDDLTSPAQTWLGLDSLHIGSAPMVTRAMLRCVMAMAALVVALGLTSGVASAASCVPLPPLITCPPPSPPPPGNTPSAPVVTVGQLVATGFTAATLTATINPGGAITTYHWTLTDAAGHGPEVQSAPGAVAAYDTPQPVQSSIQGLEPGTTYDVTLEATSSAGEVDATTAHPLVTPQHPTVSLSAARPSSIALGRLSVQVSAGVGGVFNRYAPLQLQVATAPYRRWQVVEGHAAPAHGATVVLPVCPDRDVENACPWMQQDFKLRAVDGSGHSATRLVTVDPLVDLAVSRERNGASPWLDAMLQASVHPMRGRFRSEPVYFYEAASRRAPFVLTGVGRFRVQDNTTLVARMRIRQPGAGETIACYRRPILPDMGLPTVRPGCGRRRLP
jgi:hypothetical protein